MGNLPVERHLLRARDHVDAWYAEELDVAALAAAAGMSPAHFSRAFRKAFGETPHGYLLTRRLERAAALLRGTDHTVADICVAVGLTSVGSFTTSFRRMFGVTPAAYRDRFPPASSLARVPACVVRAYSRPQLRTFREDAPAPPLVASRTTDQPHDGVRDEGDDDEDREHAGVGA